MALQKLARYDSCVLLFKESQKLSPIVRITFRNFRRKKYEQSNPTPSTVKSTITPFEGVTAENGPMHIRNLWKPLGFTVAFSSASFAGAAIWQYENMRSHAMELLQKPSGWINKQIRRVFKIITNHPFSNQNNPPIHYGEWRNKMNKWWNSLSEGERLFVPICAANVLVFCAWRLKPLQPTMVKYFCSNPASSVQCWPMLLSTFSHYSAFHLMANMYVLHSFSTGAVSALGKEQFLGLYLSAGVISSFTSYLYKTVVKTPGLSLGASGAIMAVLGFVCTQFPDTTLGIIFLPFLTFSAGSAIKAIIAIDTTGAVLGWKLFDHAAHLGGALWGVTWAYWGNAYIWQKREPLLQYWHEIRGQAK